MATLATARLAAIAATGHLVAEPIAHRVAEDTERRLVAVLALPAVVGTEAGAVAAAVAAAIAVVVDRTAGTDIPANVAVAPVGINGGLQSSPLVFVERLVRIPAMKRLKCIASAIDSQCV